MILERKTDLVQVILTLCPPRGFPRVLHRRQQQGHEDRDDGDDDKQFDQTEAPARRSAGAVAEPGGPSAWSRAINDRAAARRATRPVRKIPVH
jgi:hypothetical protein